MAGPSPARLYATLAGAALVILGVAGFFSGYSWSNALYIGTGALGLAVADRAARRYALWLGGAYVALAVWGLVLGGEATLLGFLPVDTGGDFLHLALGVLGVAAALATPTASGGRGGAARRARGRRRRRSPR